MKSRILTIAIILMAVLTSCNKGGSMASLETTVVEQKISNVDSDGSFSVDVPLKNKGGKDFVIEKDGEFRLNSINVINKKKTNSTTGVESEKPVFEVKSGANYIEIPKEGLLITTKAADGSAYKLDIRLKSGNLKPEETLDFSFSVKKTSNSEAIVLKKEVLLKISVAAKTRVQSDGEVAKATENKSDNLPVSAGNSGSVTP